MSIYCCDMSILMMTVTVKQNTTYVSMTFWCSILMSCITQSDQDPCCSLTNSITSRETDSEQHGS
jgi:hypothetical protein